MPPQPPQDQLQLQHSAPQPGAGNPQAQPASANLLPHALFATVAAASQYLKLKEAIDKHEGGLEQFSRGYEKFGFNRTEEGITYREWAPGAK
eukprot:SM008889S23660  [mRNA]  locus=s8889:294:576:+ [translate_table: standard]